MVKPGKNGIRGIVLASGVALATPAFSLGLDVGPVSFQMDSFVTLGAAMRMEEQDRSLIGKINNFPGLCTRSTNTGQENASQPTTSQIESGQGNTPASSFYPPSEDNPNDIGLTCNQTQDPSYNLRYVRTPGSFNINGDNGNMNFEKGDLVNAAAKLTSDLGISFNVDNPWLNWANDVSLFARGIWFFDDVYNEFEEVNFDTTLQASTANFPVESQQQFGNSFELLDAYVSAYVPFFGDRSLSIKIGRQGLNWGESTALALNSINTVNPIDARRLRMPGFDLKELFQPVGMAVIATDITLNLAVEAFYQFEWRPFVIDAPGTFYSTSDVFGGSDEGGQYAMLSFGKAPEDPHAVYESQHNENDPFALGSAGSRTVYRLPDGTKEIDAAGNPTLIEEVRDTGQYGIKLAYFAENFNNGTEFALYHANYHSRIPTANLFAAQETCGATSRTAAEFANSCGAGQGNIGTLGLAEEPLPVDTAALSAIYPEDIKMYGFSFNTTVGDWAWSGEYSFRPNHPVQIHTVDLLFAALQPAFPETNVIIAPGQEPVVDPITGQVISPARPPTVFPGRRTAVPDYAQTIFRGEAVQPRQLIQGYEQLKQGQLTTTLLKIYGGDNPIKASQIILIMEAGLTHIVDMPNVSQIQFQGAGTDTHASYGADGTTGTRDSKGDAENPRSDNPNTVDPTADSACERKIYSFEIDGEDFTDFYEPCRQNPTAQNSDQFGSAYSYGTRILSFIRYQDFFAGINFEPLIGLFYDIGGVGPGLGQNFAEGNFTGLLGLRFDYLSKYFWELRYTALDGKWNPRRDRDTLSLTLRYEF